jgi:hypothetical protein
MVQIAREIGMPFEQPLEAELQQREARLARINQAIEARADGTYQPPDLIKPIYKQVGRIIGAGALVLGVSIGAYKTVNYEPVHHPTTPCKFGGPAPTINAAASHLQPGDQYIANISGDKDAIALLLTC